MHEFNLVYLRRRVFAIFGVIGVFGYLVYLSGSLFSHSYAFPIFIALIGLGIIFLGIKYQKNKAEIHLVIESCFPDFLLKWRPDERA